MSDTETNYDDLFANGPAPEGSEEAATPTPEPAVDTATEQTQPEATTQPDANAFPEGEPQHKAFERLREAERKRAEAEAELRERKAIEARDREWQQMLAQQQAQQQPIEKPDSMLDPEGYEAWMEQQMERKLAERDAKWEQRFAQQQAQEYERQTQILMQESGAPKETLEAALAFIQEKQPYMVEGLNKAPNPFRALLDHAKLIGFTTGSDTSKPSSQPLAQQAAQAAAAGVTPQTTAPRGVGSVAGGTGYGNEAIPSVDEFRRLAKSDPDRWSQTMDEIIANGPSPR
jgi:DNA polymerase III gamma/tau subunit